MSVRADPNSAFVIPVSNWLPIRWLSVMSGRPPANRDP